ncbi:MAG: hypothetical protein WCG03_07360 [Kiritimatiellales bacterium]
MKTDPIVEEVRETRRKQAEKFQFDLRKIFADAKSREATSGHRLVSFAGRSECIAEESAEYKTKKPAKPGQ